MTKADQDICPQIYPMPEGDSRTELHRNIVNALKVLPLHFTSPINIEGLEAGDLFSLNSLLGGAIETQTVLILNSLRKIWDPAGKLVDKEFRRYAETFPDVRLVGADNKPLIGIELKSWYILSKKPNHP